ncbi:hypothetical protein P280DRAFT_540077 [Massarina eburnea CBS 473.64]|uniref:Rhodopsin domain-containing protein n=1 Tax=Massarina eburnea CBS 473.64 TaxID=1395130 RepID=A0A6A6S378_9PLEO|nr:hypothetical protein P280DRAFT_540077 [Massarina eburnea CBS 473.64]
MAFQLKSIPMTDSGRDSLIIESLLWLLFVVVVGLRIYARYRGPGLGLDDLLSAVAAVNTDFGLVFTSGVGWDLDPTSDVYPDLVNNMSFIMQATFAFTLIYIWCLACLKLSQLALYLRVFTVQLQTVVCIVGAIVILWALMFNFLFIFMCDPIHQQWTVDRIGHCMDQILLLKCIITTNLVTDFVIVVIPMRCVWKLQMGKTEKYIVVACFGLGLGCCVISLARFIQIYTIDLIGNLTGTSLTTFMLCNIELMLAGLCTNIPMLRPFYLRCRAKYGSSSVTDSEQRSGQNLSWGVKPKVAQTSLVQWISLRDNDRNKDTETRDDNSSERNLTSEHGNAITER